MSKKSTYYATIGLLLYMCADTFAQDQNSLWRGNQAYKDRDFEKAQADYLKSIELNPSADANYNLANSLYKQQKYEDAAKLYESIAGQSQDKKTKAEAFHNLGNAYMKSKQLDKGIEAYKNALRNNPSDEDTRYNLSYALKMKKEQEEQEKEDQDKDQDKNQDQQDKQDKQDKEDQKDQQDKQDQPQDQQEKEQEKEEQQQQQQEQKQNEISKEDAARMLENLENDEEKTQEKVQLQQRKSSKLNIENDW